MVAFAVMCSGLTSASSAARAFGGTYLQTFVALPAWAVAVAFMTVIAVVNFRGVGESVRANVVLTCVELGGLLIVVGLGAYGISRGAGEPARLAEFDTTGQSALIAVTSATALAFFAMVGFEDSVNMAEECFDPVRHFPRALLGGLAIAGVLYLLIAIVSSLLVSTDALATAGSGALIEVIKVGAPAFPLTLFAIIGLFAVSNSALINMLMASRLLYGIDVAAAAGGLHHCQCRVSGAASPPGRTTATSAPRPRSPLSPRRAVPTSPARYQADPPNEYKIAGLLLVLGLLLWTVNRLLLGRTPRLSAGDTGVDQPRT